MPCSDGRWPDERDAQREKDRDVMARLACARCRYLKQAGIPIPEWAQDWWDRHQEFDRRRLAEERLQSKIKKLRDAALAKLSPKDKVLLGIK